MNLVGPAKLRKLVNRFVAAAALARFVQSANSRMLSRGCPKDVQAPCSRLQCRDEKSKHRGLVFFCQRRWIRQFWAPCEGSAAMFGLKQRWVKATKRPEADMNPADIEWFGLNNLNRAAKLYNTWKHGVRLRARRRTFQRDFAALIAENGAPAGACAEMKDGWAIDSSQSMPHLDRVLEEADRYIKRWGGQPRVPSDRAFIKDILDPARVPQFPSLVDFALSSQMLTTVANFLGYVPVLSSTVPPGIRLVESTAAGQFGDGIYRTSQLYHLDYHDRPLVYVVVLLRDVTPANGPFTFVPASASDRVARALRYGARGVSYRVSDEVMHRHIDRATEEIVFAYPRGTVLFLDSSRCFHFGSRDAVKPRYQLMYAYMSPCRMDFSTHYQARRHYPMPEQVSRLGQMVLRDDCVG